METGIQRGKNKFHGNPGGNKYKNRPSSAKIRTCDTDLQEQISLEKQSGYKGKNKAWYDFRKRKVWYRSGNNIGRDICLGYVHWPREA